MGKIIDLTGQRFGRLTVLDLDCMPHSKKHSYWICVCDCGNYTYAEASSLKNGAIRSCGCLHSECARNLHTKHGLYKTRQYKIWIGMKDRCYNSNNRRYRHYGGKGITVCDEWRNNFKAFYDWAMANGYRDDLSIDRIDVNGNYEPSNCRWATIKEQANNTSRSRKITAFGQTKTMKEWAILTGANYSMLQGRINKGYSLEDALAEILGCSIDDLFNDAGNGE